MRLLTTLALAGYVAVSSACTGNRPPPDVSGVRDAIGALGTAVNGGDSTAFFELLATDFEVFPPGAEPLKGDAARAMFRDMFTQTSPSLEPFTNEEIQVDGDLAVQRYSFRLTLRPKAGGALATESGSGLHVWRRVADGNWRLWKDIWTEPGPAKDS